jgi:hypothetical protein
MMMMMRPSLIVDDLDNDDGDEAGDYDVEF